MAVSNRRMLFVYNPRAGKGMIRNKLADILDIFAAGGYEITIAPTKGPGDATEIVASRPDVYEVVVCCGGDGTLDETVTGMMRSKRRTAIGYIPAGSTNDYGSSLALPKDMIKAAEIIVKGKTQAVDVGRFDDDVFVYVAAFGAFTEVSYSTNQDVKNVLGHSAYIFEGAKSLSKIRPIKMKVTYEGGIIEDSFIYGMITNSFSVGGFKGITGKEVDLGDGEFEVTLLKEPKTLMEPENISEMFKGRSLFDELAVSFRTGKAVFETEEELAWTLDGENGGLHRRVEINNIHRAIDIRIGEKTEFTNSLWV